MKTRKRTPAEVNHRAKQIFRLANSLQALSNEVRAMGGFDEESLDLLRKIGSKLLFMGVTIPYLQCRRK